MMPIEARARAAVRGDSVVAVRDHGERAGATAVLPGRWIAGIMTFSVSMVALFMLLAHITIAAETTGAVVFVCLAAVLVALRFSFRHPTDRRQRIVRDMSEYVGLFVLISLLGAVTSYPAAAATSGFADVSLERIDRAFGFDWIGWYDVVAAHPVLQVLGGIAYATIFVTPALLLGHFAFANRRGDAQKFLASLWVAGIVILSIFLRMPAVGPLASIWHGPIPYMPISALYQLQLIPELRSGALNQVDLGQIRGLVCAPSFHTTSAVLYIAAAWKITRWRWPLIGLNVAMLLSIPVEGNHYLADMLMGGTIGVGAVILVALAWRMAGRAAGRKAVG